MPVVTVGVSSRPLDGTESVAAAGARLVPWSDEGVDVVWRRSGDSIADVVAAVDRAPGVTWVHTDTVGVDRFPLARWRERGIRLSSGRGLSTVQVAEWALGAMLLASRRMDASVRLSDSRTWAAPAGIRTLADQRIVIVGFGAIGRRVAALARAFGCDVSAVARAAPSETDERTTEVRRLVGMSELGSVCDGASMLVLCAPATQDSRAIVDAAIIDRLEPGAWLINAARGELIDERDLAAAVNSGQLGGAVIDVTAPEPPPADSVLWQHDNIILTGHSADFPRASPARASELFAQELGRFTAGERLANEIDLELGY